MPKLSLALHLPLLPPSFVDETIAASLLLKTKRVLEGLADRKNHLSVASDFVFVQLCFNVLSKRTHRRKSALTVWLVVLPLSRVQDPV